MTQSPMSLLAYLLDSTLVSLELVAQRMIVVVFVTIHVEPMAFL